MELGELVSSLHERGLADAKIEGNELLRYYHTREGKRDVYMFFNESATDEVRTSVCLKQKGSHLRVDLLGGSQALDATKDGRVELALAPYESVILVFDEFSADELAAYPTVKREGRELPVPTRFSVGVAPFDDAENFTHLADTEEFFDVTARERLPEFSGVIRYTATFTVEQLPKAALLSLGKVGGAASVTLNGVDCGLDISAPYRYEVGEALRMGENTLEIRVYTSLANALLHKGDLNDHTRSLMQCTPLGYNGVRGPISLIGF
jgi:hypothetical protein